MKMKTTFEIAESLNNKVANLRDNEIYKRRFGVELREAARQALIEPVIGTAKEVGERFGKFFDASLPWDRVADHSAEDVFVWAFDTAAVSGRKNIFIIPVDTIE